MPTFSICTPTYQRAATLPRVIASLARQTLRDFEWIVIDDGSSDGTAELVASFAAASAVPVRYEWQPRQGKHVALNHAVRLAHGELFVVLDSDDSCLPEALERFLDHWRAIPSPERSAFAGVTCLCRDEAGAIVGRPFPQAVLDSDFLTMRYRHRSRGEHWDCLRTDVLREFPFPEPAGILYIPETLVIDQIARRYRQRFVNEALRVYHQGAPDQLTRRAARIEQAPGLWRLHAHNLVLAPEWFRHSPAAFLKSAANFFRFSLHLRLGPREQWRSLPRGLPRALALLAAPVGATAWMQDHLRRITRRARSTAAPGKA